MDSKVLQSLGGSWQEGEAIESKLISRQIEGAQHRVEAMNFDIRKQLLDFDNVMNKQREAIYDLRNEILDGEDLSQQVRDMIFESVDEKLELWCGEKVYQENWDLKSLMLWLERTFTLREDLTANNSWTHESLKEHCHEEIEKCLAERERSVGEKMMPEMERMILLNMIDIAWKEHLYDLDHLKKGINLRAYGQKDPKIEYQKESFSLFEQMMGRIRESSVEYLFRINIVPMLQAPTPRKMAEEKAPFEIAGAVPAKKNPSPISTMTSSILSQKSRVEAIKKIGRNDPCICGSGKKYKKCCGQ